MIRPFFILIICKLRLAKKLDMYRLISYILIVFLVGYNGIQAQKTEMNREGLQNLLIKIKDYDEKRLIRVNDYLKRISPLAEARIRDNNQKFLYDVQNGQPIFISFDNAEAARAIGIPEVQAGGSLGLNLEGGNIEVGVWDGGAVRTSHQELIDRVVNIDNPSPSSFDQHATNVTGVIMAKGIRSEAKGMAPNARVAAHSAQNDLEEMVDAQLRRELLLSNHSYGFDYGWDEGTWAGDPNISEAEDWKFGYYDVRAQIYDEIAYNSPYYLIVTSAGNNRGDNGDGPFPADGPFDIMSGKSNSKNIMVVGAINKSNSDYETPSDIQITSFSGFGPTDDGRIKPDIVGVGQEVFTSNSSSDSGYNTNTGTSFSSPSVTGGLLLLQELFNQHNNEFMLAPTLKALAIQTARESGSADGPDYRFGWGLLDVEKAADLLIRRDGENVQIIEDQLSSKILFCFSSAFFKSCLSRTNSEKST